MTEQEAYADTMYCMKWHQLMPPQQAMVERAIQAGRAYEAQRVEKLVEALEKIERMALYPGELGDRDVAVDMETIGKWAIEALREYEEGLCK